VLSSR